MISSALGGLGLFLLGMILLTDGLKAVAGEALRTALARFTGRPGSALVTGALLTALVQSSTATTVMTIGFVSAGLMTFTQAVGVIFGANIGTTSTAWIVSVIGFKVSMSAVALPCIGVGALLRLLRRGRAAALGTTVAGFGLMFLGLDVLQEGMKALSASLEPGSFPDGHALAGRALLVLGGVVMVVILQSSSATVAATLTALHLGTIDLTQAAALVIGQNVGTTTTAAIAAIGANTAVKRTAAAHLAFNVLTALVAFALLEPFVVGVRVVVERLGDPSDATVLAGFHTGFNLLGVLLLFPVIGRFARLIERLLPERGPVLVRHLAVDAAEIPGVALEAARRTLGEVAAVLFEAARARLDGAEPAEVEAALDPPRRALEDTRRFIAHVGAHEETAAEHA
ncbi:MAG: Na/Pi cotransporter family protein, partial [Vicinamibacteria bacterium]